MTIRRQLLIKLISLFFLLILTEAAFLSNSSPLHGFVSERAKSGDGVEESENREGRERAVVAVAAGGRGGGGGGGDNGDNGQGGGGGVIPIDTAAAAAKRRNHKNGHHKGGHTGCKPTVVYPLLSLLLFL